MIEVERVDYIRVPVRDIEKAKHFYGEILGLEQNPNSPGDDDPAVLGTLGSSATPEDDLGAALDALRDASSVSDAQAARRRALDILLGNPISRKAYSGMPLLNWDVPRKIKDVPPGGDVRVREVRYGDTVLSDTSLLHFDDPAQAFTITYEIADLGPGSDGELAPTPAARSAACTRSCGR